MSENEQREVETIFTAKNLMASTMERIAGAGERINRIFEKTTEVVGSIASIGGVIGAGFGIERAIDGVKEHYEAVKSLSDITGVASERADGMLSVFQRFGIAGDSAQSIMLGMSKRAEAMERAMAAAGATTGGATSMFRKMGIDIRKGPIEGMVKLADKFQQGKVDTLQLATALGVPLKKVTEFNSVLGVGGKELRRMIDDASKMGLSERQIADYDRMIRAKNQISESWNRITVIIGSQLMPIVAELMEGGAKKMDAWLTRAKEFGRTLSTFLHEHYDIIVKTGKALLLNYSIQRLTGKGALEHLMGGEGESGLLKRVGGFIARGAKAPAMMGPHPTLGTVAGNATTSVVGALRSVFGRVGGFMRGEGEFERLNARMLAKFASRDAAAVSRAAGRSIVSGGFVTEKLFAGAQGIGSMLTKGFSALRGFDFGKILAAGRIFLSVAGRVTVVGAVIALIVGAFLAIKNNVYGVRDKLTELWDRISLRFAAMKIALKPLLDAFSSSGTIGKFLSEVVSRVFTTLGRVIDGLLGTMHTLIHVFNIIAQDGMKALTRPVELWKTAANAARADMAVAARMERERRAKEAAERKAPESRDRQPYFDFRNSRFDIKQQFADVDPDRIAVAFANDLAGMGERRVQSNFAPLFSV